MKVYDIKNLSYSYENTQVLKNVNLQVNMGDFIAIIGENGTGKSTLIKILVGELKISKGVKIFDEDINSFEDWNRISYVAQGFQEINFPISCKEMILLDLYKDLSRKNRRENNKKVEKALLKVNMSKYKDRNFSDLSGGQKQRILLAKAMIRNPDVLIFDEPTKGLDSNTKKEFFDTIRELNKMGKTIILVTHDIENTEEYFNYIYKISDGGIKCLNTNL